MASSGQGPSGSGGQPSGSDGSPGDNNNNNPPAPHQPGDHGEQNPNEPPLQYSTEDSDDPWSLDGSGTEDDDPDDDDDDIDEEDEIDADEEDFWEDHPFGGMFGGFLPEDDFEGDWWDEEEEEGWVLDQDNDWWDEDDDHSDTSTVEPAEEADACDKAIEATADRHLINTPVPYNLPSSTFHFQSADSIAVTEDPFFPGASLVATMDSDGVLLFRLPIPGTLTHLGGTPQPMQYLGGFESPSLSAYSMEISPSGRYLMAGGDEGSLEVYAIDSRAPQRPPIPDEISDDMTAQQPFFYLPIVLPESDWVTGSRPARVAREVHDLLSAQIDNAEGDAPPVHEHVPPSYPRTKNDAKFLHILGFRDTAYLTPANAPEILPPERPVGSDPAIRPPLGWVPRDVFFAAAVDDQYRGLELQFNTFARLIGGKDKFDWKMEDLPAVEEQAGPSTTPRDQPPKRGAVALAGMLILGYHNEETANDNTMNVDGMVNGVRFGIVAGKERLLAADQSGKVYVFEIPQDDCELENVVPSMMCESLGNPSDHWSIQTVVTFAASSNPLGTGLHRRSVVLSTATLGPFGKPLNLAVASPDGKWIAVVGDQKKVILIDQMNGFSSSELSFEPARFDYDFLDPDVEVGSQYCTWNASSTRLAVTSDTLHAVFVFSIPTGALVMRVEGYVRSVMPVMFAPWDENVLIFAEESKMLHVRVVDRSNDVVDYNAREELADPGPSSQLIRVPADPVAPKGGRRRVTGMAATRQGDVLVSTKQGIMHRYLSSKKWSPKLHKEWPEAFRKSAQTLLLCAAHKSTTKTELASLPMPIVLHIISFLAGKRSDWLEKIEVRAEVEAGNDGDGDEPANNN